MSDIIKLLPESIANQIAAGEVVQRPAAVVKELLENAIDAKSTEISLVVQDAGKSLIQVIDNGIGMSQTDARMSFERHATSKVRETNDLFNIRTLGFRGEALASIAAVSQVNLKTKRKEDELGLEINISGSHFQDQKPANSADGTTLTIKNLFFNVPARRAFLKSNPVELKHIMDEFTRVALSHPEISFYMYQKDLQTYHLPSTNLANRIVQIFGKNYKGNLATCKLDTDYVSVQGYIGKPEFAKKIRGEQFFFLNNRYIKHPYLNHAVLSSFQDLIPDKHYPFYLLNIKTDPKNVDVNVHPSKTEVKFDDEQTVYSIVQSSVKHALSTFGIAPSIEFSYDVNFGKDIHSGSGEERVVKQSSIGKSEYYEMKFSHGGKPNSGFVKKESWKSLYEDLPSKSIESTLFNEKIENRKEEEKEYKKKEGFNPNKILQINNEVIISQVKNGILVINQKAAFERILYDRLLKNQNKTSEVSQKVIFPEKVELSTSNLKILEEIKHEIKKIGFDWEKSSDNTIEITALPVGIDQPDIKELLETILDDHINLKKTDNYKVGDSEKKLLKTAAAKLSNKCKSMDTEGEKVIFIEQLFKSSNPNYTPRGEKIITMVNTNQLLEIIDNSEKV